MDTQWIAFAVLVLAMTGGAFLMFLKPAKPDPEKKDQFLDRYGGPPYE